MPVMKQFWLKYSWFILLIILTILFPGRVFGQARTPFIWPLQGEVVTTFRQQYWDQEKLRYHRHTGIDIQAEPGSVVRASANGRVNYRGISPTGGLTLVIRHNMKIRTTYLNLSQTLVSRGEYVYQSQVIARIGAEDDSSSSQPHLHFGVIFGQAYLDPLDLLDIDYSSISRFIYLDYIKNDYQILSALTR